MGQEITVALQITAIGMGLVFGAIALLWGVIAILVRFAKDPPPVEVDRGEEEALLQQAAIAAVGVALAELETTEPREFPLPPTSLVSAWQAVMRSKVINKRGPVR